MQLTKDQKKELQKKECTVTHPKLLRRIHVIQMKGSGLTNKQIQEMKGLSHGTISTRLGRYRSGGIGKLLHRGCNGREPSLSSEQLEQLKKRGKKGFTKTQEAQSYIKSEFGISFKVRWVQELLKKLSIPTKKQANYLESAQQ